MQLLIGIDQRQVNSGRLETAVRPQPSVGPPVQGNLGVLKTPFDPNRRFTTLDSSLLK